MTKPKIFLLHFAGGNYYSYRFLFGYLNNFEIVPLELPGRGKRVNEGLLKDFNLVAKDLFNQIRKKVDNEHFVIYGHSMGASLALKITKMLEDVGMIPKCIFVSGNPGPGIKSSIKRYLMNEEEFIQELKKLGGMPPEFFNTPALLEFFLPVLRADFEIAENNELHTEAPVSVPIYAIMGRQEDRISEITNWAEYTNSAFKYKILEGDHFFIYNKPSEIAEIITESYKSAINGSLY